MKSWFLNTLWGNVVLHKILLFELHLVKITNIMCERVVFIARNPFFHIL